ncbi:ABC transporter ATP-binding protein [Halobiforma lacisalsi AJ5]|uniref:ABC transporter ATP-binding protein n=1 Tax=Natronobacterium lacisalsi AJ5 TaxID=358396 RepID=M0LI05_NATLA|nr:ATP-binding cassette domain-containing protein [Halobiforma lacisalsi]APW99503.1 ABC transporter ATP-binding protein [Halobiforma lacisalsi AJ5]EMA31625.1 sulfate-transporting ATPase [Halobiforma lacisalsi AJ5]
MAILEVEGLRKEYDGFTAVEGSSFSIERGEVFGVVGPNGAGKTTTLKMLAGLVEPTAGTAVVAGHTPGERAMQRRLGFLPEESPLYEEMTATDYLEFFADLYDVPGHVAADRIESSLDRLDLEHRDRRIGNMSKGMKRKVAIARALINDPDVLIFDEPASGLDPLTTNHVIEFTEELSEEGKTVVFSAHNLYHVESVCDRVVIMNDGRIVARGTLEGIRDDHGGTEYHVYATVDASDAVSRVSAEPADEGIRHVVADMDAVESIRTAVEKRGGRVTDIQTETPSLEDVFLEVASGDAENAERRREAEQERADGQREQVVDT